MADILWTDVVNHAAGLADPAVNSGAKTDILGLVNSMLNPLPFGGESSYKYKLARIYLAAHIGTLEVMAAKAGISGGGTGGTLGPVIAESEGGLTRSYASILAMNLKNPLWGATIYGQEYAAISSDLPVARLPFLTRGRR